jgi:hypothetical protein
MAVLLIFAVEPDRGMTDLSRHTGKILLGDATLGCW